MRAIVIACALLFQPAPPQVAALGPPTPIEAGVPFVVWVVVFGEGDISTTVPSVVELLSMTDATPAGMQGMRWLRYTYRAPAGVYALDYTACSTGGCASSRAAVRVGWQVHLPLIQR